MTYFTTLDAYLAGFLVLAGHEPELSNEGKKVVFVFKRNDNLNEALTKYYNGSEVPASRYAFTIKTLKGMIHDLRRVSGN